MKQVRPLGDIKVEPFEDLTTNTGADRPEGQPTGAENLESHANDANGLFDSPANEGRLPRVLHQMPATGRERPSILTSDADLVGHIAATSMQGNEDSQEWPTDPVKQEVMGVIRRRSNPIECTSQLQAFVKRSPSTPPSDVDDTLPVDSRVQELEQTDDSEAISTTGAGRINLSDSSSSLGTGAPSNDMPSDLGITNVPGLQVLEPQVIGGTAVHMTKETLSSTEFNDRRLEPEETQRHIHDLGTNAAAQDHSESFSKQESVIPLGVIAAEDGTPNLDARATLPAGITNTNASLFQPREEEALDSQNSQVRQGRSLGDYLDQITFSSETGNEDAIAVADATVIDFETGGTEKAKDYRGNRMRLSTTVPLQVVPDSDVHAEDTSNATGNLAPLFATEGERNAHGQPRAREDDTTTGEDSQDEIRARPAKRVKTSPRTPVGKKQSNGLPLSNILSIQETPRKLYDANSVSAATTPTIKPSGADSMRSTVEVRIPRSLRKSRRVQPIPGSEQQLPRPESGGAPVSSGSSIRTRKSADPASSLSRPSEKGSLKILYASSTNVDNLRSVMKVLTKHGVRQVQKVADCDYLCVGHGKELKKTGRLILAVAMGKYVISDEWAKKSAEQGTLLDPHDHLAKDPVREKEWGTGLTEACERGQKNAKPLLGRKILFTPFISKDLGKGFGELKDIATVTGATMVQARLPRPNDQKIDTFIISSNLDPDLEHLKKEGWRCFSTDVITVSVLRGVVDLDSDEFSVTRGKGGQEGGGKKRKRQS